jgi:chromosome condensin MukBEF complex kleisin-like MukF subunit
MPPLSLEDRVAVLEQKIASMEAGSVNGCHEKPWLKTMGQFEDLKEIFDEAMKLREADRARARRGKGKKSPAAKVKK